MESRVGRVTDRRVMTISVEIGVKTKTNKTKQNNRKSALLITLNNIHYTYCNELLNVIAKKKHS